VKIINNTIRVIDYVNEKVYNRSTPESFNEYVGELISHIKTNENVRLYNTLSNSTEVISCVLDILKNKDNDKYFVSKNALIANRLLRTEKEAQNRIRRMNVDVRKGSLIQALLQENDIYFYLLAKVEHSDFVDDTDFTFKTGFSKDKKTIWKSCLIDLSNPDASVFDARIYSDTKAKYWSSDFLELQEVITDEENTINAFKSIDSVLNRTLKKNYKSDYVVVRNACISYMKNNEHIDYNNMINCVLENYVPSEIDKNKLLELKNKLYELPEKKKFDRQFNSIPKAINARIGKVYKVNTGIEVKITDSIDNIKETIAAYQDADGARYLRIKTNDEDTYNSFKLN
jgi:hypothetical protein